MNKMPYKFEYERLKIPRKYDNRIKLSDQERVLIKQLYGRISQRKLAKRFNVSRRLIIFIGDPEKYKHNIEMREDRGGSMIYYNKIKANQYKKKHRKKKYQLYLNHKLTNRMNKIIE